jgi:hypothetical protein
LDAFESGRDDVACLRDRAQKRAGAVPVEIDARARLSKARDFIRCDQNQSGYLANPLDDPQAPTNGSAGGSTHAWSQIYLPGAGWIDFDPTSGSVGNIDLVTVAVVPDPRHAIPLHGTYVGFPSDHLGMEVQVNVTFDSRKGDLDPSATDGNSTIGPMHAPRRNRRSPISHHGYLELEAGAKRSQPAPAALPQAEGGA